MKEGKKKAFSSIVVGLGLVLMTLSLGLHQNRLRADDYPTYPKTQTLNNWTCGGTDGCTTCPDPFDQTVVYGAKAAKPDNAFSQGLCKAGGGSTVSCIGTYYECERVTCVNGKGDDPPAYTFRGNWCKAGVILNGGN